MSICIEIDSAATILNLFPLEVGRTCQCCRWEIKCEIRMIAS